MPPGHRPPLPEGCGQIAMRGNFLDTDWANIFHVHSPTAHTIAESDWQSYLDDFIGAFSLANFYGACSTDLNVTECQGIWHDPDDYFLDDTRPVSISGAQGGDTLAASNSVCISWTGRWHYRGGKPKTFLSGGPAAWLETAKVLLPAFQSSIQGDAEDLIGQVNALVLGGFTNVVFGTVSYQSGGAWRTPPIFRQYLGAVVHSRIASQRRRDGDWMP